jgi:hypothetical protein
MSMMHKLFRPAPGRTLGRYVQAFVNGTGIYRGDLVCWDVTAPTLQGGTAGTVEGKTMSLLADFLYVILPPAAVAAAQGLQAGKVEGTTIRDDASNATAQSNDGLAIIQTWGVARDVWVDSTDCDAGTYLCTGATTGEWVTSAVAGDVATLVNGTDSAIGEGMLCGVALAAEAATWVRGTVTNEQHAPAFIRCDF